MTRPDEVSDDMLMALADGELNDTDSRRLHQRIASDSRLAARYADFAETRALLREAFAAEPIPDRLISTVMHAPMVPDLPGNVVPMRRRLVRALGGGLALAASVLLVVGGFWLGRGTTPGPLGATDAVLASVALPTGGKTQLGDGSTVRVLGSYDTERGLCRLIGQDSLRHVACRDAQTGAWAVALTVPAGDGRNFLPASELSTGLIDRLLEDLGAGPALDGETEQRALHQ